ncbi:MAG TPA: hypothetical protein VMB05_08475 [Solirubrobacteraceae bacterium]|nr:hypothetical protein [Solirubrobacteraceae bacterium]
MRRRLSYANVVATLALVFAMSGGALAAKHYLINSTNQINPKVLKKLKGNAGKAGAQGAAGAAGAAGKEGPAGKDGKDGKDGKTGPEGPPGEPGSARAFAAISGSGVLDAARSENVASVKLASTGIYCITLSPGAGTDSNSTAPVVTPDANGGSGFVEGMNAYVETQPVSCSGGDLEVVMRQVTVSGGAKVETNTDSGFTIVVP